MVINCATAFTDENSYNNYFQQFKFPLSDFQKWAIKAIVDGDNVLVTAHTGSGKTLPAEFALNYFKEKQKKIIYASPIKALSNQKLYDFRNKFPHISFGILTGDIKDNPDADVLIMTTEILRNSLFNKEINKKGTNGSLETSLLNTKIPLPFEMDFENNLGAVVFDEVHYINDAERGSVWEQAILLLPPQVQLIMLSATIDRPEDFASWIENEKNRSAHELNVKQKKMYLAPTYERVVPLKHYMWLASSGKAYKTAKGSPYESKFNELLKTLIPISESNGSYYEKNYYKVHELLTYMNKNNIYVKRQHLLEELVRYLNENEMLPAICFVFSRKQVEQCAKEMSLNLYEENSPLPGLIERECRHIISSKIANYNEYLNLPEYNELLSLLKKGIAIHHAGIMPVLREMVELLFEKNYIKLLFATDSVGIGLDLPVKTVLFTGISKYSNGGVRQLYSHEYTQVAGRAGRRGKDSVGYIIHCNNLFDLPTNVEYKNMLTGPPQSLTSKFKISYNLILNILHNSPKHSVDHYSFIEKFANKSLLHNDISKEISHYESEQDVLLKQLDQKMELLKLSKTPLSIMKTYKEKQTAYHGAINSAKKKLKNELNNIEAEHRNLEADMKKYDSISELEQKITVLNNSKINSSNYIHYNVESIFTNLLDNKFIDYCSNDYPNSLVVTKKGIIASQLQEVHPLVLSELYETTNGFERFDEYDLIGLFSCFNNIKVSDELKTFNPNNSKEELNKALKQIESRLDYYYNYELKENIDSGACYDINYDLLNYVINWAHCISEEECKTLIQNIKIEKNIFLGEFVKELLKINNITKEFEKICELFNNLELLQKLNKISSLTLKYIATNQSLYI